MLLGHALSVLEGGSGCYICGYGLLFLRRLTAIKPLPATITVRTCRACGRLDKHLHVHVQGVCLHNGRPVWLRCSFNAPDQRQAVTGPGQALLTTQDPAGREALPLPTIPKRLIWSHWKHNSG